MSNILVSTVALSITRDAMTILPATLPAHELPITQAIFGEDNVQVLDQPGAAVELEPSEEAERLERKYGTGALVEAYGANYKGAITRACKDAEVKPAKAGKTDKTDA